MLPVHLDVSAVLCSAVLCCAVLCCAVLPMQLGLHDALPCPELNCWACRDAMAVFAMEAASIISERSLEISFASALSTVSASGLNVNAGECCCCPSALHDSCGRPLPCICSPLHCVTAAADLYHAPAALCILQQLRQTSTLHLQPCICSPASAFLLVFTWLTTGGRLQQITEHCQTGCIGSLLLPSGLNPDMGE